MLANGAVLERDLVAVAARRLRGLVPVTWKVDVRLSESLAPEIIKCPGTSRTRSGPAVASIEVTGAGGVGTFTVVARRSLEPRDVERLFGSVGRTLRTRTPGTSVLVVAPWLSARTRDLLSAVDIGYVDLTGNALVRLDDPALFIRTDGAARDPSPAPRAKARVRGPKAGRLIRTLADVRPPYGVRELSEATGLTAGYVARLLDALDDDALVQRARRGRVESADVAGLVRRWASSYDLLRSNDASAFLAPRGAAAAISRLADLSEGMTTAVTGSFAAVRIAPVTAPALLAVYVDGLGEFVDALGLIPADRGADVVVLRPFDPVVWERTVIDAGIRYVAPSQIAVDCLTGTGRMPAEGEAVLEWMLGHEPQWRSDSLADVTGGSAP